MKSRKGKKSTNRDNNCEAMENVTFAGLHSRDNGTIYRPSQLSGVLEVPSTSNASDDNGTSMKPSDLAKASLSSRDSFDISLEASGPEEDGEEEEEEEKKDAATSRQQEPKRSSRGLTTVTAIANAYDPGQSMRTSMRNAGIHMRFSEKRHWYVEGPAVYVNLDAFTFDDSEDSGRGRPTITHRAFRRRHHGSSVNEGSVITAYERWTQKHPGSRVRVDEDSSESDSTDSSIGEEEEEESDMTNEILQVLQEDDSVRDISNKDGSSHGRLQSDQSTNNAATQSSAHAQRILQAVPCLDQEAPRGNASWVAECAHVLPQL